MKEQNHITFKDLLELSSLEGWKSVNKGDHKPEHCSLCEKTVQLFKDMKIALQGSLLAEEKAKTDCPKEADLIDAFERRGDPAWRNELLSHAETCPHCFNCLAFYFKAAGEMKGSKQMEAPDRFKERVLDKRPIVTTPGIWEQIKEMLHTLLVPLRSPVAGYGLAIIFLFLLVTNKPSHEPLLNLASAPQLKIYPEGEAGEYGFQGPDGLAEEVRPFEGMAVKAVAGGKLLFSWPEIEGCKEYRFSLFRVEEGRQKMLTEEKMAENRFKVNKERFQKKSIYRWTINGSLENGKKFEVSAEFVYLGRGNN